MRPDHAELIDNIRLGAIALASAVLTAALVIGVGQGMIERRSVVSTQETPLAVIQVVDR